MAEINIPVSVLYSENTGTKPEASQLEAGQLWINLADGAFGSKNSSGQVVSFGLLTEAQRTQALAEVNWGSIEGDITQQTDLQSALNQKANSANASFTGTITVNGQAVVVANQITDFITADSDITGNAATATTASTADKLTTARSISATGDASWSVSFDGSANASASLTLANTGVSAGVYGHDDEGTVNFGQQITIPNLNIDAKGRVLTAKNAVITLPSAPTTITGNAGSATILQTARTIDGISFNGSANISRYAVCSTSGVTVAKEVTVNGFELVMGATAILTFTNGNTASNPTLNINSTGAKPIINSGVALANAQTGTTLMVVYDGTNYQVVGGVGGVDFSQYYTKAEMDAKFMPVVRPTARGTVSIYSPEEAEAQPVVTAYNEAKASSAQSTGVLNCYTKEEADALFATIVNPVIIDTLTVEDEVA